MACHLQIYADPDPVYHSDADPDPDPTFQFDADPCVSGYAKLFGTFYHAQKESNKIKNFTI